MSKIKLVTIDVDDTLLNSNGLLLDSTKEAIKQAIEQDVKVVLCSGRPLAGVSRYLSELGLRGNDQYVITYHGGVIETVSGEVISKHVLQTSDFDKMNNFSKLNQVHFNVLDDNSEIYTTNHCLNWFTVMQAAENEAGLTILDPDDLPINFTLVKGVYTGSIEELNRVEQGLRELFSSEYSVVRAAPTFLEVSNSKANKGNAVADLAKYLNIEKNQIMAIGDERNDLPMFKVAAISVAMNNGNEEVKKIANYVTADNDHDGIAEAFKRFVL